MGEQGTVHRGAFAGKHATRRRRDPARNLSGLFARRLVGWLLAGLCFVLPAFAVMLALTLMYAAFGATPLMHGALYGLGPVVLAFSWWRFSV